MHWQNKLLTYTLCVCVHKTLKTYSLGNAPVLYMFLLNLVTMRYSGSLAFMLPIEIRFCVTGQDLHIPLVPRPNILQCFKQ